MRILCEGYARTVNITGTKRPSPGGDGFFVRSCHEKAGASSYSRKAPALGWLYSPLVLSSL